MRNIFANSEGTCSKNYNTSGYICNFLRRNITFEENIYINEFNIHNLNITHTQTHKNRSICD